LQDSVATQLKCGGIFNITLLVPLAISAG